MAYIFDVFLILVCLAFVLIGRKKGFVRMLLGLVRGLIAFFVAVIVGNWLAGAIFDGFLSAKLTEIFSNSMSQGGEAALSSLWENIPVLLQKMLESGGMTQQSFETALSGASQQVAQQAVAVVRPVVIQVLSLLLTFILFLLFFVLLGFVIKLLDKVFKLPLLNQANRFMGGFSGFFVGVFAVLLICFLAGGIAALLPSSAASFLNESVRLSYIKALTDAINPFI